MPLSSMKMIFRVSLWVDSMEDQWKDNPVIVFKQQGKEQSGDLNDLSKDDFLVAIQTSFQRDMLKREGAL